MKPVVSMGQLYRHNKSERIYGILATPMLESNPAQKMVVYADSHGIEWVRPMEEFKEKFTLLD